ncbi:MAG: ABC transporter permease subunit, partial [Bdellovibrionales bacterium]|nr:ABC transporter permease subunit [Bdellovibrionales bacterium]
MMMPVFAIVKKDMRAFLTSPMFYTLLGLCVLLWSIFFSIDMYNFIAESFRQSSGKAETGLNVHQNLISNYIVLVHYVLVFIIAAFTIKFFTEEKRVKTFSLLLSSPLASWQLVLAKLMVGACVLILLLAVSAVLPLSLGFFVH